MPTFSIGDNINTHSPDFRDFLLNRNLILDTIENNGLTALLGGIGKPASIDPVGDVVVMASEDIETDGILYKDLQTVQNKYQGDDDDYRQASSNYLPGDVNSTIAGNPYNHEPYSISAAELYQASEENRNINTYTNNFLDVNQQTIVNIDKRSQPTYQIGSYLDENGHLNDGLNPNTIDATNEFLKGGGTSTADARASIAGRTINNGDDTRMGQLAASYLAANLGYNIAQNLENETAGKVNTDIVSLLKGNDFIVPNYNITVPKGKTGKAVDFLARLAGFEVPVSLLEASSSIFAKENQVGNIEWANSMITNTGKGQVLALFDNILANESDGLLINRYRPGFKDSRVTKGANTTNEIFPSIYALGTSDGAVKDILSLREGEDGRPTHLSWFSMNPLFLNGEFNDMEWNGTAKVSIRETNGEKLNYTYTDNAFNKEGRNIGAFDGKEFKVTKGLLYKTQEMFNSNKMRTLVSGRELHGDSGRISEIQTGVRASYNAGGGALSKGSGVLSTAALEGDRDAEVFCRTWSTFKRYNNVKDLQKNGNENWDSGINPALPNRNAASDLKDSVLGNNGFVKIGPYTDDKADDIKKFMFSIENLAWNDDLTKLLPCEIGPGDLLSGNKGRIMWFPPYDISFNETTSVSWDKNNFIGRGEPIFTYNNTERTGQLSWKIIIDHPNYMNFLDGNTTNDEFASMVAGCYDIKTIRDSVWTKEEQNSSDVANNSVPKTEVDDEKPGTVTFSIYFPNDSSTIPYTEYESGLTENGDPAQPTAGGMGTTTSTGEVASEEINYPDNTNFGLNYQDIFLGYDYPAILGWQEDDQFAVLLGEYLSNECKYCKINIKGYASTQGNTGNTTSTNTTNNDTLSQNRADNVKTYLQDAITYDLANDPAAAGNNRFGTVKGDGEISVGTGCSGQNGQDRKACKEARKVVVTIEYSSDLKQNVIAPDPIAADPNSAVKTPSVPISRFFTECNYFEKLDQESNVATSQISEKLKNFHPAFHSITPEGFNSRLNFLHQCTRQGPTNSGLNNPDNLAFGRPPVCILRLGDFYHSKIVIDNLTFDYEPLVWDLNPEGIGVQPMIANVTMSFAFIGGSSLKGPINKLQNAVSFNFFANTEVYDPRADRIGKVSEPKDGVEYEVIKGTGPAIENTKEEASITEGLSDNTNDKIESQEEILDIELDDFEEEEEIARDVYHLSENLKVTRLVPTGKDIQIVLSTTDGGAYDVDYEIILVTTKYGDYEKTLIAEDNKYNEIVIMKLPSGQNNIAVTYTNVFSRRFKKDDSLNATLKVIEIGGKIIKTGKALIIDRKEKA